LCRGSIIPLPDVTLGGIERLHGSPIGGGSPTPPEQRASQPNSMAATNFTVIRIRLPGNRAKPDFILDLISGNTAITSSRETTMPRSRASPS
jgi:hypothetical protein